MRLIGCLCLLSAVLLGAPAGLLGAEMTEAEALAEIAALKQRIAELERLKERLDALEKRLASPTTAPAPPTGPSTSPPAAPPTSPPASSAAPPVKVGGYVQMRYEWNEARTPKSDLLLRRARLRLLADPAPWVTAFVQIEAAGGSVENRCTFIDLKTKSGPYLRLGQFMIPFGLDMTDAPHERVIPEVARVFEALFNGSLYDRGFYAARPSQGLSQGPAVYLGMLNGAGINRRDTNGGKDVVARVVQPFPGGHVGVSAYSGRATRRVTVGDTALDVSTPKDRYGVEALGLLGRAELRGEWLRGRDLDNPVDGGYVLGLFRLGRVPGIPFIRYDWFDPNRRAGGDYFGRWTLGYAHQISPMTRLTLWQELSHDSLTRTGDNVTSFQVQQRF